MSCIPKESTFDFEKHFEQFNVSGAVIAKKFV